MTVHRVVVAEPKSLRVVCQVLPTGTAVQSTVDEA